MRDHGELCSGRRLRYRLHCYFHSHPLHDFMSINFLKFKKRHWWRSCYVWAGYPRHAISFMLHFF
ncbi:hypothetical protein MANES_13G013615v8 [Manihot esculenta]|uniref:Nucleotide-diphospho-sugar transferase domain-containing protein n=1 Tax=Manihot esculenta TaxID=3983 RepID=A0A2C9UMZ3_MANES|nr:hypothetical protein MANES_13G013615v8 [Manihot esculenta]